MPVQFDNEDSLRAQRMTADEAKAVIDRWQRERAEQTGLTDRPAVPDVAEGLDLSVEEVQRLLHEVRDQRAEEETQLAQEQELTEIRLAEEERKLAEVRRQRAELQRQQAEAERRTATEQTMPLRRQEVSLDRHSLYTKKDTGSLGYKLGGIILGTAIFLFISLMRAPHPAAVMPYARTIGPYLIPIGKINEIPIICTNGSEDVPCDDATLARERKKLQQTKDQEVAVAKKQAHDRQTHRRSH